MEILILLALIFAFFFPAGKKDSKKFKTKPKEFFLTKDSPQFFGNQFMSAEQKLQHLKSNYWIGLKNSRSILAKNCCELCQSKGNLHLHHITYIRLGCESINDVILLCSECHTLQHLHYGYDRTTEYYPLIKPKQSE